MELEASDVEVLMGYSSVVCKRLRATDGGVAQALARQSARSSLCCLDMGVDIESRLVGEAFD